MLKISLCLIDSFESNENICMYTELLVNNHIKLLEFVEFLNLGDNSYTLKEGTVLVAFKSIALFDVPVYLMAEDKTAVQKTWIQDIAWN